MSCKTRKPTMHMLVIHKPTMHTCKQHILSTYPHVHSTYIHLHTQAPSTSMPDSGVWSVWPPIGSTTVWPVATACQRRTMVQSSPQVTPGDLLAPKWRGSLMRGGCKSWRSTRSLPAPKLCFWMGARLGVRGRWRLGVTPTWWSSPCSCISVALRNSSWKKCIVL